MKKAIAFFALLILSTNAFAKISRKIECIVEPRAYIGNIYLDLDPQEKTYEINYEGGYEDSVSHRKIAAQGTLEIEEQDSMGFEHFTLCAAESCSANTVLGELKAVDSKHGRFNDRASYFRPNPFSDVKIEIDRLGRRFNLDGIIELSCSYDN